MSLVRVFLLLFFISPQVFAQTPVLTADVVTDGIDVSLSENTPGFELYRCAGAGCDPDPSSGATNRISDWVSPGSATYEDRNLSPGTIYRYQARHYVGGTIDTNVAEATAPQAGPPPLTELTATYDAATNSISLRWPAVAGATGYDLYRCEVPESGTTCTPQSGDYLGWQTGTTTYEDRNLSQGTYRYQVIHYADGGGTFSVRVIAGTPRPPIKFRVVGLKATAISGDSISLAWKPTVRRVIKAYSVYRCTVPEGESTCDPYDGLWIAYLPNSNTYTDTEVTPGETYRYAVAVEPFRREELSGAIMMVAQTPQMLSAPTGLMVTETGASHVRLSWTAPEDDGRGPIDAIDIYRCNVDRSPDCSEFLFLASRNPVLTEYKDNDDVEQDTTYRYVVAAYRSAEEVSPWSNQVDATTERGRYASPTDLTVTATYSNAINLSWTAPGEGILGYNVYRCSVSGGGENCEPVWHAWVANPGDAPPAPTSYTDTGGNTGSVIAGTTYRYVVAASFPPNYRNGERSEAVTATAEGEPMPEAEVLVPTGLNATYDTDAMSINLSWIAPSTDIVGYSIYRCEEGDVPCTPEWKYWVANEGDAPPAPTVYVDIDVVSGTTYRYAVTSNDADYDESPLSDEVTVLAQGETDTEPETPSDEAMSTGEFEASFESGHQWFRRDVVPELSGNTTWNSIAWKGERIQQHILVNSVPSNSQISLVSSDLTNAEDDTIPASAVSFRYPRFAAGHTEVRSCNREYEETNTTVYLSDALFSVPTQALPASWPELVWMSVDIPSETPAGEYSGTVTVNAVSGETSAAMVTLQVSVQVAPWVMPDAEDRQFHLDLWQFPVSVLDRYNDANPGDRIEIWSEDHYTLLGPTYRYLAGLGQRTVTTYIKEGALGAPSMIQWTLKSDGAWQYDYSVFDAYVTRLASWGLDQQISAFSPVGWNPEDIPYWDEATQSKKIFTAHVGSSEWNTRWSHFLADFRAHLVEMEWLDKTVLYLDESSEDVVQTVIDLVGAIDENWKIGLAYIGYGSDGPGENVLSKLYDSSGSMVLVGTTYVDSGLITGETYRYAVDACNDDCSAASSPVTVMAQTPAVPGEPTGFTGTSAMEITLNWSAPSVTGSSALTGYNIYRCVDDTASCTTAWFDRVESGTTYTDSDISANTNYRYSLEACNGTDCGNRSGEITVMTGDTVNDQSTVSNEMTESDQTPQNQAVPGVPTDLAAFAASATAIQLSWEGNATNGYDVYRCIGSETCTPVTYLAWTYADNDAAHPDQINTFYTSCVQPRPNSFLAANADPRDAAALSWHALQRRLDGYLRWAFDNWRSSDPLNLREGSFTAGDFSLVYRSSNDRDMTVVPSIRSELLRDGIEDFEKVQVLRSSLSSCNENDLAGRWLDRLERTVETFSSGPLMAGRAGDLINRAHARLDEISLQLTPDCIVTMPEAPTGLTAVATADTGINLNWTAPSDDIVGYSIYRCEEGETPCMPEWIVWVANAGDTPPAPTEYSDSEVAEGTTYRYAVASNNIDSDGEYHESDWSDEVTALAQGGTGPDTGTPLAAPTGLTVTETTAESVSLSWDAPADGILGYNVYRCVVPEDEMACDPAWHVWVANEGDAPPAPTNYTDTGGDTGGVSPGTTYLYTVGASYPPDYDNSEQSEAVTALTDPE